ncbi:hypothetical protein PLESTB_000954700 [Pleodorina starrii]|uniref:AP2/ERF domain-containing protein n=1 Tax=Pleodorina starrii TaxID=330485 RepID=A0A9W6BNC4_9CHLO|nr:hypothetical protein PLESTM_001143900 [Pleodorina starrii]GLC55203.1 hypothetical protein PLESTB_000954700 [Pleodorina starrii]GLC71041.1 hypothetical protein PLESTF_001068500 [Pleodorina starrii]
MLPIIDTKVDMVGDGTSYFWEQPPVHLSAQATSGLGGSSMDAFGSSSSSGRRPFPSFHENSSASKNGFHHAQGAAAAAMQSGLADSLLLPQSFNAVQIPVEQAPPYAPGLPLAAPCPAPAPASAALPRDLQTGGAGALAAAPAAPGPGACVRGVSLPPQELLPAASVADVAAAGVVGRCKSPIQQQQLHGSNVKSLQPTAVSLGPGPPSGSGQPQPHQGLLQVEAGKTAAATAAGNAASAELQALPCAAISPAAPQRSVGLSLKRIRAAAAVDAHESLPRQPPPPPQQRPSLQTTPNCAAGVGGPSGCYSGVPAYLSGDASLLMTTAVGPAAAAAPPAAFGGGAVAGATGALATPSPFLRQEQLQHANGPVAKGPVGQAAWAPAAAAAAAAMQAAMSQWPAIPTANSVRCCSTGANVSSASVAPASAAATTSAAGAGHLQQLLQGPGVAGTVSHVYGAQAPPAGSRLGAVLGSGVGDSPAGAFSQEQQQEQQQQARYLPSGLAGAPAGSAAGVLAGSLLEGAEGADPWHSSPQPRQAPQQPPWEQQQQQQAAASLSGSLTNSFLPVMGLPATDQGNLTTAQEPLQPQPSQQQQQQQRQQQQQQTLTPLAVPFFSPAAFQLAAMNQTAQAGQQQHHHHPQQPMPDALQQQQLQLQHQQQAAAAALSAASQMQMWWAPPGMMTGMLGLGLGMAPGMCWPPYMGLAVPPGMPAPGCTITSAAAAAAAAAATHFQELFHPAFMMPALAQFALPLQAGAAATQAAAAAAGVTAATPPLPLTAMGPGGNATAGDGVAAGCATAAATGAQGDAAVKGGATSARAVVKAEAVPDVGLAALSVPNLHPHPHHQQQQQPLQAPHPAGGVTSIFAPEATQCAPSTRGQSSPALPAQQQQQLPPAAAQTRPVCPEARAAAGSPSTDVAVAAAGVPSSGPFFAAAGGDGADEAGGDGGSGASPVQTGLRMGEAGALGVTRLQSFASADLVVVDALQLLAASPLPSPHRERRTSGASDASVTTTGGGGGSRRPSAAGGADPGDGAEAADVRVDAGLRKPPDGSGGGGGGGGGAEFEAKARVAAARLAPPSHQHHSLQSSRLIDLPDPTPIGGGTAAGAAGVVLPRSATQQVTAGAAGRACWTTPLPPPAAMAAAPSATGTLDRQRLLHLAAVGAETAWRKAPSGLAGIAAAGDLCVTALEEGEGGSAGAVAAAAGSEAVLTLPTGARGRRSRLRRMAAAPGGGIFVSLHEAMEAVEAKMVAAKAMDEGAHASCPAAGRTLPVGPPDAGDARGLAASVGCGSHGARGTSGSSGAVGGGRRRVQWAAQPAGAGYDDAGRDDLEEGCMHARPEDEQGGEEEKGEGEEDGGSRRQRMGRQCCGVASGEGGDVDSSDEDYDMREPKRRARGARPAAVKTRRGHSQGGAAAAAAAAAALTAHDSDGGDGLPSEHPSRCDAASGEGDGEEDFAADAQARARRRRIGHGRPPGAGNLRRMKPRRMQSDGRLGFSMRSSRYTGVYRTPGGRWRAQFCYRGAVHQLGMYDTEREAAAAWDQAVVTFRGSTSGVQLNLPQLLNSYDLQDVQESIHRILDSKIATTRTKRCLNSYARNPPGPKSPSRAVPAVMADNSDGAEAAAAEAGGGSVTDAGGGGGRNGGHVLEGLPRPPGGGAASAVKAEGDAPAADGAADACQAAAAAAAVMAAGGGRSDRGRARAGLGTGDSWRRRQRVEDSRSGGSDGDDGDGRGGAKGGRGAARRRAMRLGRGGSNACADTCSDGGDGGVVLFHHNGASGGEGLPLPHGPCQVKMDGGPQQSMPSLQLSHQPHQPHQQRLKELPVGDAALLGLAALRRQLPPLPPAVTAAERAGPCVALPSHEAGGPPGGGPTTISAPAAMTAAFVDATPPGIGPSIVAPPARPPAAADTTGAAASSLQLSGHAAMDVGGGTGGEAPGSSSGGEDEGAGGRSARPPSPKRRKRHATRSRDC